MSRRRWLAGVFAVIINAALLSCSSEAEPEYIAVDAPRVMTFVERIHPDMPLMRFELSETRVLRTVFNGETESYRVTITINWYETGEVIQEIYETDWARNGSMEQIYRWYMLGHEPIIIEDLNFDGYKDIRIAYFMGMVHVIYLPWVFDIDSNQFIFHRDLSEIPNIHVDAENQIIWSWERVSGRQWITYYEFIDNTLTPIKQVRSLQPVWEYPVNNETMNEYDITFEWADGEWVEVDRVPSLIRS